jgi:enoyl-CoA hydratase/carnithine racemase
MEEDDDIRCAILTGDDSGGAFSAGADLKGPGPTRSARPRSWSRASPVASTARSRCWATSPSRSWAPSTATPSASAAS